MAIIYQTDKRVGITYAYENKPFWDKERKQSRSKRTLIGRVDPITGEIIATNGLRKKAMEKKANGEDLNYKELYEKLLKKLEASKALNKVLQNEIKSLKEEIKRV